MAWVILFAAIALEVSATLALRAAQDEPLLFFIVAIGYTCSLILLPLVLKRGVGLGVAYGIWGSCGVASVGLLSVPLFGETVTPLMLAGIGLIIAGVLTVQLGFQRALHQQDAKGKL